MTARSEARKAALERGDKHFMSECRIHGFTKFNTKGAHCVECKSEQNKKREWGKAKDTQNIKYIQGWPV